MTLNVPEAEARARKLYYETPGVGVQAGLLAGDFLVLAALAQELAALLDRNDDEMYADERHALLAKARAAGLLPARESAPAEPELPALALGHASRNQPDGHSFEDRDGDGLCDYETDFPALERRCLNGREAHKPKPETGEGA